MTEGAGAKVFDRSPYGNNGTITPGGGGLVAFWANTLLDKPVGTFDGLADFINCGTDASLDLDHTYTVALFVTPLTATINMLISWGEQVAHKRRSMYLNNVGILWFSGYADNLSSAIDIQTDGLEHHIAYTISPSYLVKIYVDGRFIISDTLALETPAFGNMYVGKSETATEFAEGQLRGVRVYNRVLDDREIKTVSELRRRL